MRHANVANGKLCGKRNPGGLDITGKVNATIVKIKIIKYGKKQRAFATMRGWKQGTLTGKPNTHIHCERQICTPPSETKINIEPLTILLL